jgi:hypothetical protein
VRELGEGGQGKVHLVLNSSVYSDAYGYFLNFERDFRAAIPNRLEKERFSSLQKVVNNIIHMDDPKFYGALKVLHKPQDARNAELSETRIENDNKAKRHSRAKQNIKSPRARKFRSTWGFYIKLL